MDLEGLLAFCPYLGHYFPCRPRRRGLRCLASTLFRSPLLPVATYRGPPCARAFIRPVSHPTVLLLCPSSSCHFFPFHPHLSSQKQGNRPNHRRRLHRTVPLTLSCRVETRQDAPFRRPVYLPRNYPFRNCWVIDRVHRADRFATYPTRRDRHRRPRTFLDRGCRYVFQHVMEPRAATPMGSPAILRFAQSWDCVSRIGRDSERRRARKGEHKRDITSFKSNADARPDGRSCDERTRGALRGHPDDDIRRAF